MLPRQIVPGQFYMLTRRTAQRQFVLRPDDETNETFLYCLAEAAQRFAIDIILPSVLSNHHHTVLFDRHGRIVEFTEHFHKMTARAMNALRGRCENLWSSEPPSLLRLVDAADVVDKLVYAATNPVKDHLVERVHQWPGVNGLGDLLRARKIVAKRPRHFFSANGSMPDEVTLELVIPPELGDADEIRATLRERVAAVEAATAEARHRSGAPVLGRRAILHQSWRASPSTPEQRGDLSPRIAARDRWSRLEALVRDRNVRRRLPGSPHPLACRSRGRLPHRNVLAASLCERPDSLRGLTSATAGVLTRAPRSRRRGVVDREHARRNR
jgi:putative transposase